MVSHSKELNADGELDAVMRPIPSFAPERDAVVELHSGNGAQAEHQAKAVAQPVLVQEHPGALLHVGT